MRVLHLTDLHGRRAWYRWLNFSAHQYDLVCITGDLIDHERDIPFVRRAIARLQAPVALCSGNHDLGLQWLRPLRTSGPLFDCGQFRLVGATLRCLPWGEPLPVGRVDDIWLIHAPPSGTSTAWTRFGIDFGDHEFREFCLSGFGPKIALCGHVHESAAWNSILGRTLVLNPGFAGDASHPNFNVLDLGRGTVRHYSARQAVASLKNPQLT